MSFKLKRFSESKQDQVVQLVEYVTLLGITGEDLVSIGNKMIRDTANLKSKSNMEIIDSFECLPIGEDHKSKLDYRFKLKTANGAYNFNTGYRGMWHVSSLKTKKTVKHMTNPTFYDLPKTRDYARLYRYSVLLDIANGKLTLNF